MKRLLVAALMLCCSVAFSQAVKIEGKVLTKADMQKPEFKAMMSVTDRTIYDQEGNVVDSVTAKAKEHTFEYGIGIGKPKGQTEYKRMLFKTDTARQNITDGFVRKAWRPESPKLWEGVTLDLTPLSNRVSTDQFKDKALVLIFWTSHPGKLYERINEVIGDYIGGDKFKVLAITHLSYTEAASASKKDPILNAKNIVDAQNIIDFYGTENKPTIVVTNTRHQITFAIKEYAVLIPRTLNKLLKQL